MPFPWAALAMVGSSIIGGMGSSKAAKTQAKAAEDAGQLQLTAARESIAEQRRQFNIIQKNSEDQRRRGKRAGEAMEMALFGPQQSKYSKFVGSRKTPPVAPPPPTISDTAEARQPFGRRQFNPYRQYRRN